MRFSHTAFEDIAVLPLDVGVGGVAPGAAQPVVRVPAVVGGVGQRGVGEVARVRVHAAGVVVREVAGPRLAQTVTDRAAPSSLVESPD